MNCLFASKETVAIAVGFGTTPSENPPDLPNETRAVANSPVGPVLNGSIIDPVNK